jgi:uncharacterized protein (TIGR02271 family)
MGKVELSRSEEWELENDSQDIRGWEVVDESGQSLGRVEDLIIDTDEERVTSLRLDSGREVPASSVQIDESVVRLGSAQRLGDGTVSDGTVIEEHDRTMRTDSSERLSDRGEERLPIIREELRIGKRPVERGGVRVESRVEETPVEEEVRLREERVTVERHPTDRPVTDGELENLDGRSIEVTERGEEAVVDKRARVVEEVVVKKDVEERTEQVRDTVRRTDVNVEQLGTRDTGRTSPPPDPTRGPMDTRGPIDPSRGSL